VQDEAQRAAYREQARAAMYRAEAAERNAAQLAKTNEAMAKRLAKAEQPKVPSVTTSARQAALLNQRFTSQGQQDQLAQRTKALQEYDTKHGTRLAAQLAANYAAARNAPPPTYQAHDYPGFDTWEPTRGRTLEALPPPKPMTQGQLLWQAQMKEARRRMNEAAPGTKHKMQDVAKLAQQVRAEGWAPAGVPQPAQGDLPLPTDFTAENIPPEEYFDQEDSADDEGAEPAPGEQRSKKMRRRQRQRAKFGGNVGSGVAPATKTKAAEPHEREEKKPGAAGRYKSGPSASLGGLLSDVTFGLL